MAGEPARDTMRSSPDEARNAPRIRTYLLDDQALIRAAFRVLLSAGDGVEVVGESGDPAHAVAEVAALLPDVVVLDLSQPGLLGLDLIRRVRRSSPRSRLVVLTHHGPGSLERARSAGAEGYVAKECEANELRLAITAVHGGGRHVSEPAATTAGP